MLRGRRSSRRQLALIVEQLPDSIVWTTDERLRVTAVGGGAKHARHLIDREPVAEAQRRALAGESSSLTVVDEGWAFDVRVEPVRDGGAIVGAGGVALDASRRRLAERALAESEARFRTLVERLPICTYINPLGFPIRCTYISPYVEKLLGFPAERWLTEDDFWVTRLHPDDRERVREGANRTHETGEPFRATYRMLHADGHAVTLLDETIPVSDENGTPLFLQGFLLDIDD
jgi:PAS domain S-box-containing protein